MNLEIVGPMLITLLIGVLFGLAPKLTRPDIFFAVTVSPTFRATPDGRLLSGRYYIAALPKHRRRVGTHSHRFVDAHVRVVPMGNGCSSRWGDGRLRASPPRGSPPRRKADDCSEAVLPGDATVCRVA